MQHIMASACLAVLLTYVRRKHLFNPFECEEHKQFEENEVIPLIKIQNAILSYSELNKIWIMRMLFFMKLINLTNDVLAI